MDGKSNPQQEVTKEQVARLLDRSDEFHEAAVKALSGAGPVQSGRCAIAFGFSSVSIEHWASQRILLRAGLEVTAFALLRLQFETVTRAIWILECAKAEWLERFTTAVPAGQLEEPVLGPPMDAMLNSLERAQPVIAGILRPLKDGAWIPMHSYVHGGARPIAQAIAGATNYQVAAVLRNGNGLGLLAVNVLTNAFQNLALRGVVARLQSEFRDCLPPQQA